MRTILLRSALPVLVLFAAALPAAAQTTDDSLSGRSIKPKLNGAATQAPRIPPPAAVPGAKPRADSVAPQERGTNDLPPTEALFDAINRGDIASAKDALSRGADLDGTNLLGLTPLELSVDLARNDISFLLLSLRGASPAHNGPPGGDAPVQTAAQRRLAERQEAAAARAQAVADRRAVAKAPREAPSRQGPTLFAGDGGTPVPSAGFLGFDSKK